MRLFPLLLFIAVPIAELTILIKLGDIIGVIATIALVISTAVIGVSLLKRQGMAALARARGAMDAGEFPVESVVDGVCLLVAGAFLLTPGLLTDMVGFLLLVPAFRLKLARWIFDKFKNSDSVQFHTFGEGQSAPGPGQHHGDQTGRPDTVIEGEFQDLDDEQSEEEPPSSNSTTPSSSPWRK